MRTAEVSEKGYYYNTYVKIDDPASYMAALENVYAKMKELGHNASMQVFLGDTGETAGLLMVSAGVIRSCSDGTNYGCSYPRLVSERRLQSRWQA